MTRSTGSSRCPCSRAAVGRLAARRRRGCPIFARSARRVTTADGLRPEPGSVVDIIATLDSREVGGTLEPSVVVARAARVIGVDAAPSSRDAGSADSGGRVGVVVLVTVEEASRLADATARGALMLALDPPEEACLDDTPVACAP